MAIIYSYPTVTPEKTDLVLGTDVSVPGKPTKNFTVQSIIDLVTTATGDLQFVLNLGNTATGVDINLTNNAFRGGSFVTVGGATVSGTTGTGFTNITSTEFTGTIATPAQPNITSLGTLSALVISGPISGTGLITNSNLTGAQNDNVVSTLAIKTYVDNKVGLYDTLQEVLANGNTTGGSDIVVSAGDDVTFTDTSKILMGTTAVDNFEIYSDSANSIVIDRSPGALKLQTSLLSVRNEGDTTQTISASAAGAVELYHAGDKKIETLAGGAKVTGAFQATTSGTFASLVNTGTYTDSSGDVGTAGQLLSSTGSGTNWVTELPLYTWSLEGTAIPSGTAVTVTDGTNITTTWDATNFDLTIATTGVPDGSGAANQVTYWSDADTLTGAAGFTFAGGATGKVAIGGELEVGGVLTDGTFTGSAGTYTGYASITSTVFVGALTGNASTATALATSGAIALTGDTTSTGGPYTYTSGGALNIATTIADTTVTGKVLTNLPTPTSAAIAASDTILAAMAKLQGQITGIPQGLVYKGTWNASTNTPTLTSGTGVTGEFYIVSVAGTTNLDGITDWQVGDWAIFVEVGATDTWQKIDNTSAILGSGAANKIAKWTGPNTLATGLIADDGTTVTVGNSGNLVVEGNTTLGDADTDSTTVKGPAVFEETVRINEGISLGANTYGIAGQVLTSGGGSSSVNTWTTPTTGTVTSVTAGTGITIGGTAVAPTVAIDYLGTDNAILSAPQENGIATTDTVWFSDATDNNIKKTTVANLIALDPARSLAATLAVGNTSGTNNIQMADSQSVNFGDVNDLRIFHNSTTSLIQNFTGNLEIRQTADDMDIIFYGDDMSGGITPYFRIDGSEGFTKIHREMRFLDDVQLNLGSSSDLRIYHNATDSTIDNRTGNLILEQNQDDGDIVFKADNGSGGVTEYFRVDGGAIETRFLKSTRHFDDVGAYFGDSADLQIYHDGSNSYIVDTGTGGLTIQANSDFAIQSTGSNENFITAATNAFVKLYYNGVEKLATTSTGVTVTGSGTFTGEVTATKYNVSNTSGYLVREDTGSGYGLFKSSTTNIGIASNGNVALNIDSSSNSTFSNNVQIDGNLTVDGSIIHGGGKSGIFNGNVATNNNTVDLFKITRTGNSFQGGGQLIFDVYATSELSGGGVLKYTVAHRFNVAPVYNKIIDSQGTNTMALTFTNSTSTSGTAGDSVLCQVTTNSTQNISYTVQVGFSNANTVVVT